jgi:hypothetical protein
MKKYPFRFMVATIANVPIIIDRHYKQWGTPHIILKSVPLTSEAASEIVRILNVAWDASLPKTK